MSTAARAGIECDAASVGGNQSGHDGKAKARSRSSPTGLTSPETVEGVRCALCVHSRARIVDLEENTPVELNQSHVDRGSLRRMPQAVGNQVQDNLTESRRVAFGHDGSVAVYSDLSGRICRRRVEHCILNERHEIDMGSVERPTFIDTGQQ